MRCQYCANCRCGCCFDVAKLFPAASAANCTALLTDCSSALAQAVVDEWCTPRLRTFPVTEEQIKRYRVVVVLDPPCHKQASRGDGGGGCCPRSKL